MFYSKARGPCVIIVARIFNRVPTDYVMLDIICNVGTVVPQKLTTWPNKFSFQQSFQGTIQKKINLLGFL